MRAPYRVRWDPRYPLATLLCRLRDHRPAWTGTHYYCTRCGSAGQELNP